uniref:Uncharacterized protein n=1 Tax=Fusarium oxysporum (strain Fo5176) TaxID=660025 RepID=A0A0D2YKT3_FUSOF
MVPTACAPTRLSLLTSSTPTTPPRSPLPMLVTSRARPPPRRPRARTLASLLSPPPARSTRRLPLPPTPSLLPPPVVPTAAARTTRTLVSRLPPSPASSPSVTSPLAPTWPSLVLSVPAWSFCKREVLGRTDLGMIKVSCGGFLGTCAFTSCVFSFLCI